MGILYKGFNLGKICMANNITIWLNFLMQVNIYYDDLSLFSE